MAKIEETNTHFFKKISKVIFLVSVSGILLLLCFGGELFLSKNGYLLLKHILQFDIIEEFYHEDVCYETVVNGDHTYIIHYGGGQRYEESPYGAWNFSLITDNNGIIDFYITKENEKISYTITEPLLSRIPESFYKNMDMVMDFLSDCWKGVGFVIIGHSSINEGRFSKALTSLFLIIALQIICFFVIKYKIQTKNEYSKIYQIVWRSVFGFL